MKKVLSAILLTVLVLALAACGTKDKGNDTSGNKNATGGKEEVTKLVIGASNTPHAVILEKVKPLLKEKGYDLQIETYQEYVLPNKDLASGLLDANYFQTTPYLDMQIADFDYDFVIAGEIHIEPMGVYSKEYKSLDELPNGATILMSNSVSDHGRVLELLEENGLITLAEGVAKVDAELSDIVDNPKNLKFEPDYEAALLPTLYNNNEGDAVLINSNYAIDAGLNPLEDSIAIEKTDSPYVNVVAVRAGDENNDAIKALVEVLKSDEIQEFMLKEWGGSVVPVK